MTSKRPYADLADYAAQQGAPVEAFESAGWHLVTHKNRPALEYSTLTGPRWRYLDGGEKRHDSPTGYKASWYRLAEALLIAAANGRPLVLVNGAAGVVVAQHHGIPAFAMSSGETWEIPPDMLDSLKAIWPGAILIAFDCDEAGRMYAAKKAHQLLDAGFIVKALDLQLGKNGDIADFCTLHGSAAPERLADLPEIAPAAPDEPRTVTYDGDIASKLEEWCRDIVLPTANAALAGRGKHSLCINPNHRESHASARIGKATRAAAPLGLMYFCTCGAHSLPTVAKWLGLDFKAWLKEKYPYQSEPAPSRPTVEALTDVPITQKSWCEGVPDIIREGAFNFLPKPCALFIERFFDSQRDGLLDPDCFTADDVIKAFQTLHCPMSKTAIYKTLDILKGVFFPVLATDSYKFSVSKTGNKSAKGRPVDNYRLLDMPTIKVNLLKCAQKRVYEQEHPADGRNPVLALVTPAMIADTVETDESPELVANEIKRQIDPAWSKQDMQKKRAGKRARARYEAFKARIDDPHSTTLPANWPQNTQAELKEAYAQAFGREHKEFSVNRRFLHEKFGASGGALNSLIKRAGLQSREQKPEIPITRIADISDNARELKGKPLAAFVVHGERETYIPYNEAAAPLIEIEKELKAGGKVRIQYQVANQYTLVSEEPVIRESVKPPPG